MTSADTSVALMADRYLQMRRAMGYKLFHQGQLMLDFVRYFQASGAEHVSTSLILDWTTLPVGADPTWWYARLGAIRPFAQYLQAFDPQTQVPDASLIPDGNHRALPYIFSEPELGRLLSAADRLHPVFRAHTYRTYITLIAVTGMRRSEATGLDRSDIDWEEGTLTIRDTKFAQSRLLPLHRSTVAALQGYASQRDQEFPASQQDAFFVSTRGTRLIPDNASQVFSRLVRDSGMPTLDRHHQPHLHDLRH